MYDDDLDLLSSHSLSNFASYIQKNRLSVCMQALQGFFLDNTTTKCLFSLRPAVMEEKRVRQSKAVPGCHGSGSVLLSLTVNFTFDRTGGAGLQRYNTTHDKIQIALHSALPFLSLSGLHPSTDDTTRFFWRLSVQMKEKDLNSSPKKTSV